MGEDPGQIRQDIEEQRTELGDTVSALAYKADVPSRVKDSLADKRDRLKEQMSSAGSSLGERTPEGSEIKDGAKQAVGVAQVEPARPGDWRHRRRLSGRDGASLDARRGRARRTDRR